MSYEDNFGGQDGVQKVEEGPAGRGPDGKFAKGNSFGGQSPGRPRKKDIAPILAAITTEISEEKARDLLRQAIEYAVKGKSWKGILQILQLSLNYQVGRPVQRNLNANMSEDQLRALLMDDEEDGDGYAKDAGVATWSEDSGTVEDVDVHADEGQDI